MDTNIILIIVIFLIMIAAQMFLLKAKSKAKAKGDSEKEITDISQYKNKYKKKYLLSQNEKKQYDKIKVVTDSLGLVLFTKVRLADIIEPVAGIANWKTYWNKIQSKHVDFLICTGNLDTLCALEIDDNSHKRSDRIERDNFVDYILNDVSIKILHTAYVNEIELKTELEKMLEGVKV